MLVSCSGEQKQLLADGERKSIATDRVVLVPGPDCEVQVVRDIYRMFVSEGWSVWAIAEELNRRGISYLATKWDYDAVHKILTHPKYMGWHVFNQSSCKLSTPRIKLPHSQWILTPSAFKPIVGFKAFNEAQQILSERTINQSDQELLDRLKALLVKEGRLTLKLIKNSPVTASPSTYRYRFGTMRRAFQLIGYGKPKDYAAMDSRRRTQSLRRDLMERLVSLFPGEVFIRQQSRRWRGLLVLSNGLSVSILVAPYIDDAKRQKTWQIQPVWHERGLVIVLARLAKGNLQFLDFHVLPNIERQGRFYIHENSEFLRKGARLRELSDFCGLVCHLAECRNNGQMPIDRHPHTDN